MRSQENVGMNPLAFDSVNFAAKLRSGPVRSMIDRVVRNAAEIACVPFMVLGIRHSGKFEFISTHGVPLSHYQDSIPARILSPKLFAREIEVVDLHKHAQFSALNMIPMANKWRYAGNCPIRLDYPISDGGVLALSCADIKNHERGGQVLAVLRGHAEFIANLISLSHQIKPPEEVSDPNAIVVAVVQAAVVRFGLPICVLNRERQVVAVSEGFSNASRLLGGSRVHLGERLSGGWMTEAVDSAVAEALRALTPCQWIPLVNPDSKERYVDVFPFDFAGVGQFAVLALHKGIYTRNGDLYEGQSEVGTAGNAKLRAAGTDGSGPLSRFLDETLIPSQRLLQRNKTSYVGVRRWRSAIKKHQISALKALKGDVPDSFVERVATEMAEAVRNVYGTPRDCVVVPVPASHSGPNGLSHRLALELASQLDLDAVEAFAPPPVNGKSSHPRKNATRAEMKLLRVIDQPVLLVDDVASSGSHIDEAAKLLRGKSPSVWPVVWIAA
jgi:hypoxanthine-guanine phosphoribosyltransferase